METRATLEVQPTRLAVISALSSRPGRGSVQKSAAERVSWKNGRFAVCLGVVESPGWLQVPVRAGVRPQPILHAPSLFPIIGLKEKGWSP